LENEEGVVASSNAIAFFYAEPALYPTSAIEQVRDEGSAWEEGLAVFVESIFPETTAHAFNIFQ